MVMVWFGNVFNKVEFHTVLIYICMLFQRKSAKKPGGSTYGRIAHG
jgi:hypothetical protein